MAIKVRDLKLGEVVELGSFDPRYPYRGEVLRSIRWFKLNDSCEFITCQCETYLPFDYREHYPGRSSGDPDWYTSNIRQFLNASTEEWYTPSHEHDRISETMRCHPGFLYDFEQYEVAALVEGPTGDLIALPDDHVFQNPVFTKKKQPKRPMGRYSSGLYDGFMLINGSHWINAAAFPDATMPIQSKPVRPTCYIDPNAEIDEITRRLIKPKGFVETQLLSMDLLMELFGK